MDEPTPQFPRQAPAAAPPRRPRGLLWALTGLYLASSAAALFLIWRGGGAPAQAPVDLLRSPRKLLASGRSGNVGWVSIHGPIYHSGSGKVWERGMEQWSRRIRSLSERSEIKAIVLDIDSPGGSVGAVQELHGVIQRVRAEQKKPVVALLGDVAASGGYYLASACDKVVAHPGSLLGSIGVIFNTMNVEGLFAKLGLRSDPIKSGRLKDIGSPTRAMTREERELLQALIDDAYGQFLGAVSRGRGIPEDKLRPLADGRIFTGRQALGLGLVDSLGDSQDAVKMAAELGGISGKPKVAREGDSLEIVLEMLDSAVGGSLRPEAALAGRLQGLLRAGLEYRWTGL